MKEYKTFQFKAETTAEEAGVFFGKASVYGVVDFYNDVVEKGAFTKSLMNAGNKCVVLSQHRPDSAIGVAELLDSDDALYVKRGALELGIKQAEEDYLRLKAGIISGISIGYEATGERWDKGVRFLTEIKLWEVSLVTFPACDPARVTGVKAGLDVFADTCAQVLRDARRYESLAQEIKEGRVFSSANYKLLCDAHEMLGKLRELGSARTEEDADDKAAADAIEGLSQSFEAVRLVRALASIKFKG